MTPRIRLEHTGYPPRAPRDWPSAVIVVLVLIAFGALLWALQ